MSLTRRDLFRAALAAGAGLALAPVAQALTAPRKRWFMFGRWRPDQREELTLLEWAKRAPYDPTVGELVRLFEQQNELLREMTFTPTDSRELRVRTRDETLVRMREGMRFLEEVRSRPGVRTVTYCKSPELARIARVALRALDKPERNWWTLG